MPSSICMHFVMLCRFEVALRRHCPTCCVPYIDSRLDCFLPIPRDTSMFTAKHFGNSNGAVTTGMAANWTVEPDDCYMSDNGLLIRDTNNNTCDQNEISDDTPFTNLSVRNVRSIQSYAELCQPFDVSEFTNYHDKFHYWILVRKSWSFTRTL